MLQNFNTNIEKILLSLFALGRSFRGLYSFDVNPCWIYIIHQNSFTCVLSFISTELTMQLVQIISRGGHIC